MSTHLEQRSKAHFRTTPMSIDLEMALSPWQRRLSMQQSGRWLLRGLVIGLMLACLVLLISRLLPWPHALSWAMAIGLLCVGGALVLAIRYRPSLAHSALLVDQHLYLHDRLSTAWELREDSSILAGLQRRDALKHIQDYTPAQTISFRPSRALLLMLGTLVLALALLITLPNPMTTTLQQQAALQARLARQVAEIQHIRQELAQAPELTKAQQHQLDQLLQDLSTKLQQAKSASEAQQAIAQAQAKIDQLRNPQTTQNTQAQKAASNALQSSSDPALKALGQSLATNNVAAQAAALEKLAGEISKAPPQQKSNLAQQLEQAANQASQNSKLSSDLHNLAKSITDGNSSEQSDAAKALQQAASQDAQNQSIEQSLNQASQQLQQMANNLAASTDGSQNQQAQQSLQTQGQQGQQAQQSQQAQGQQGQQAQQSQQAQGQQGQQGQGSKGTNGAGNGQGKSEQVYVPGQLGTGTSQQADDKSNGTVQAGNEVPYSQVIAQYDQVAHDAIDNSNISPDLKDLVHEYFDSLEGQ